MKLLNYALVVFLFLTATGIVVGGYLGIKLNEQKIEDIDNNPIYVELSEKVKSGELLVDEGLGLILVRGMKDAHVDAGYYLVSIFDIFIYIGFFLIFLISILAIVTFRLYTRLGLVNLDKKR